MTALLRFPPLRRLWTAQFTSGIGDMLGLLVLLLLAMQAAAVRGVAGDPVFGGGYRGMALVVAAVFGLRLLSTLLFGAVLLGPISALVSGAQESGKNAKDEKTPKSPRSAQGAQAPQSAQSARSGSGSGEKAAASDGGSGKKVLGSGKKVLDRRWTLFGADALRALALIVAPLWIDWTPGSAFFAETRNRG